MSPAATAATSPSGAPAGSARRATAAVGAILAILAVYALGFALCWPRTPLVSDEQSYLRQAWAFSRGERTLEVRDALTGRPRRELPGAYPPGTAALQAPLVRALGVQAAPLVSLLAYCGTTALLLRWLLLEGRSPWFALLFAGYLPALVLGRAAMSDLPSALVVTGAQLLLVRSGPAPGRALSARGSLLAGLLATASLLVRETNVLFTGPLLAGAVLRREGRSLPLLLGAALGLGLKLGASWVVFGHALFVKDHDSGWSLVAAIAQLPLYLLALLVLAPLGLAGALLYRGPRRAEIALTALGALAFFSAWGYSGQTSGLLQRLVLGPRYLMPLLPLLAVALAESLPRAWARLAPGADARWPSRFAAAWALAVLLAAAAVHPALARAAAPHAAIAQALAESTSPWGALVHDPVETGKYLAPWDAPRSPIGLRELPPSSLPGLVARDGIAFLALLERGDTDFHRQRAAVGERWREEAARFCVFETVHDGLHRGLRLRVLRTTSCARAP